MADSTVSFRIKVDGAPEATADVGRVKAALEGVQGSLDAGGGANQRYTQTSTEMTAAQKQAAVEFGAVGTEAAVGSRGVLAQTQEVRSLANALLADLIPGLRIGGREVAMIGREFGGATESSATLALGFGALAVGVGIFLGEMKEANREVQATRFAELTEDLDAAEKAIKTADRAISDYSTNIDLMGHAVKDQNAVQGVLAAVMVGTDNVMQQTNQKVREAIDLNTGYMGGLAQRLGHLTAEKTALEGQRAALEIDKTRAQSVAQLTDVYAKEAEIITRTAAIDAEAATRKGRLEADAIRRLMERATTEDEVMQLSARAKGVEADAATKAAAIKQKAAADVAKLEMDAAKAAAESWVQFYDEGAKLADLRGKAALEAAKTGEAFVEAAHRAAAADAEFFGTSLADLEGYQAKRRQSIDAEAAIEAQRLTEVYEAERQAQLAKLNDPTLGPAGRQTVLNTIETMERAHTDALIALEDKRAVAAAEDANRVTEERRKNYAKEVSLAEATYAQLAALGQEDVAAHIQWAQQKAQDENLSKTDRMKYEKEAFEEQRKLDQDTFALKKALGLETEVDVLQHLANETSRYAESSSQRIKAETEWANEAKKLRNEVADIGKSQLEKIVDELKAEGNEYVTLDMVMQRWAQNLGAAQGAMSTFAAGGGADIAGLKMALDLGPTMGALQEKGVFGFQAIGAEVQRVMEQLFGVRDTAKGATQDLGALGVPVAGVRGIIQGATTDTTAWGGASDAALAKFLAAEQRAQALRRLAEQGLIPWDDVPQRVDAVAKNLDDVLGLSGQASDAAKTAGNELQLSWFGTSGAMAAAASSSEEVRDRLGELGSVGGASVKQIGDDFTLFDADTKNWVDTVTNVTGELRGAFDQIPPSLDGTLNATDEVINSLRDLGSAGGGAADTIETSFDQLGNVLDQIGGSLGGGLRGTLDDTLGYVDDFFDTLNGKIEAGASTTADNIFGTLNDRIKDELDAEARAS